jgi:predicted component of type VI protein secretion system
VFVLSGPDVGRSFDVTTGATVGRNPDCAIILRDKSISRAHAHFEEQGGRWFVVDDGSRNGVFVEGERSTRGELVDQQEFRVGEVLMRFRLGAPSTGERRDPRAPAAPPIASPSSGVPARPIAADLMPDEIVLEGADDESADVPATRVVAEAPAKPSAAPAPARPNVPLGRTEFSRPSTNAESRGAPPSSSAGAVASPAGRNAPPVPPPRPLNIGGAGPVVTTRSASPRAVSAAPAPSAGAGGAGFERRGDRVLQFHKEAERRGFLVADLSQYPVWVRGAIYLLLIAFFCALVYFAYRATTSVRERAQGAPGSSSAAPAESTETPPGDAPGR